MSTGDFPAGYYGKLPARGDFITRGLPPQFVNAWDGWLQLSMQASRERLGEDWLESYLSAPLWRFLLPPGMLMAQAVAGVFCPSVDRIGRHFPFTIAAMLGTKSLDEVATLLQAKSWFARVEEAALAGLDPVLDLESYGSRMEELAFPGDACVPGKASAFARPQALHLHAGLQEGASCEEILRSLVQEARPASCALWLTEGSETIPDSALATDCLPSPAGFAAMLEGRWVRHGWRETARSRARRVAQPDA